MCTELGKRLLKVDGLSRRHLFEALAQRLVQLGALLAVKVVPVSGDLERHHAAFGANPSARRA
ncbi:MAG TPA: hypothetical protein VHW01_08045 [Polyangiaceae bacterium]|nr:hypothetical protein [Polyangiaceae bacterium]